jgi:hypothetical protein
MLKKKNSVRDPAALHDALQLKSPHKRTANCLIPNPYTDDALVVVHPYNFVSTLRGAQDRHSHVVLLGCEKRTRYGKVEDDVAFISNLLTAISCHVQQVQSLTFAPAESWNSQGEAEPDAKGDFKAQEDDDQLIGKLRTHWSPSLLEGYCTTLTASAQQLSNVACVNVYSSLPMRVAGPVVASLGRFKNLVCFRFCQTAPSAAKHFHASFEKIAAGWQFSDALLARPGGLGATLTELAPRLVVLELWNAGVTDDDVALVAKLADLRHLRLAANSKISDAAAVCLSSCRQLSSLDISACLLLTSDFIDKISRLAVAQPGQRDEQNPFKPFSNVQLQQLFKLSWKGFIPSWTEWVPFINHSPFQLPRGLQALYMDRLPRLSAGCMVPFQNSDSLALLSIDHAGPWLNTDALVDISKISSLKAVVVNSHRGLCNQDFYPLGQLTRLQALDIENCFLVNKDVLAAFAPRTRVLFSVALDWQRQRVKAYGQMRAFFETGDTEQESDNVDTGATPKPVPDLNPALTSSHDAGNEQLSRMLLDVDDFFLRDQYDTLSAHAAEAAAHSSLAKPTVVNSARAFRQASQEQRAEAEAEAAFEAMDNDFD